MKTKTKEAQKLTYQIEGDFLGFIPKPGDEFKYIKIKVGERIISIKLAKELREIMGRKLMKGDRLSVLLDQKDSGFGSKLKLKTDRIERLNNENKSLVFKSAFSQPKQNKKGKILLCRKSSCTKRGGKQLYRTLIESLTKLGLQEQVSIELTGCQKQCKKAPSLILMPGKIKQVYVHSKDLTSLLKAHYL